MRACALLLTLLGAFSVASAQTRQPIVLTDANSTRAIALDSLTRTRDPFPVSSFSFVASADTRTRVLVFVMNLDLLAGEDASALTADGEDSNHRLYKFKVEDVRPVPSFGGLQQVILRLSDDIGDTGDILLRLNLHGVASNRVRISIGHTGGTIADDAGSGPTPAPAVPPAPTPTPGVNAYTGPATDADTVRFLEQASWGPTPAEVARVKAMGFNAWLNEQFAAPVQNPAKGSDYPDLVFPNDDPNVQCPSPGSGAECGRDFFTMYPVQRTFFTNALTAPDQLRQRVAWALHQVLVVSGREISRPSWMTVYLQALDRNAFGNYRTLLQDITLNPGMGEFLDMRRSTAANPNENFPREVLQLFSIGVDELNIDGTPKLDAQGNRIPTYSQTTVNEFTRVFTGWVFAPPIAPGIAQNYRDPMVPSSRATNHDTGTKTLLNGVVVPANQTIQADLNAALDNIFNHANTGPFVGKQLIQHLVTSNPSPAYVARVARVFNNDCDALYPAGCSNQRGNLRAVVKAILLDPEARGDVKNDPSYGKLREPVQFINNALRAFNASAFNNPNAPSDGVIGQGSQRGDLPNALDQPVFLPATVFSYFTPGYEVPGTGGLLGPAFEILSTSTTLRRANTINTLVYQGISTNANTPAGTQLNFPALDAQAGDPAALAETLNAQLLHGTMTAAMKTQVINAVNAVAASNPHGRAQAAIYLVMTSPQYQVQR